MKSFLMTAVRCVAATLVIGAGVLLAQTPDGSDISKAIPLVLGQTVTDVGDAKLSPYKVYKIVLAKGQQFNAVATTATPSPSWILSVVTPTATAIGALQNSDYLLSTNYGGRSNSSSLSLAYQVPAAGTYYVILYFNGNGVNYSLQVTAQGTPIAVPNPATAGCLSGRVDYITYSLQFIAAGLPDEVSIGGTKACSSCSVKAPLYPEIASKLEGALKSNVNAEACYDSSGNIFQVKLVHP